MAGADREAGASLEVCEDPSESASQNWGENQVSGASPMLCENL
jgi:hypothetical protein